MKETKLTFITDTHHFSKTLSDGGRQYKLRSGSDQKCLMETGDIIDAAFRQIADSDADAVMIIGDVTNDGERVSHEEFREKLYALQKKKKVYVITATHDWCSDDNPRRYCGNATWHDVPVMASDELRDFYYDFGPNEAVSEFITHLGTSSYAVDIGENVRLLALNDDQSGLGGAGFSEEHFQWIEAQAAKAAADGKILIAMEHHPLIAHIHPMVFGGSCVKDREMVASRLADAGIRYMFVGHTHIQCIDTFTSKNGNTLKEVNVGSLVGYPAPIVNVTVCDAGLKIDVDHVKTFTYEGETVDALPYLQKHATDLFDRVMEGALISKAEFADRLSALGVKGKDFGNLVYIVKPLAKKYFHMKASGVVKLLRALGCGGCVDKQAAEKFKDKPLIDFVHETWLSMLDGHGRGAHDKDYYNLVMSVANALVHVRAVKLTLQIRQMLHGILTNDRFENAVL
ncbi:MAG: metallophosphoesterase [Clostridia bacterium]|nr:metallophosphoesterase [Clostridia bacterium]